MTKCRLSDDSVSFVKCKNLQNMNISYLVDSTWNIYATEGKVDSYEAFSMMKSKWNQNK